MTHAHYTPAMIWPTLRSEAEILEKKEPVLSRYLQDNVLGADSFLTSLGGILAGKLATPEIDTTTLRNIIRTAQYSTPVLAEAAGYDDLISIMKNDPAAHDLLTPFLHFKGFHALQTHRVAHWLWHHERKHLALYLQSRVSSVFGVDIHPAARIGHGVMMDHATGIVIGETAIVEDDVLFWHGVTLGGKGTEGGDRHPKIRKGALLGAGSTILGPLEIGPGARVAAGSVVLEPVPANTTVAGIPSKAVSKG